MDANQVRAHIDALRVDFSEAAYREAVVAALVGAWGMDPEDVEEIFMPGIDNQVRATFGHDGWLRWVR
jgi:hypothetical protein